MVRPTTAQTVAALTAAPAPPVPTVGDNRTIKWTNNPICANSPSANAAESVTSRRLRSIAKRDSVGAALFRPDAAVAPSG